MEKITKHPLTVLIIGSIITYLLIPKLQESSIRREAIAEFELRLVKSNNDIGFEFNELLVLFENFAREVGSDSIPDRDELHEIQKSYLHQALEINSRIYKIWFDTKNLKNELYLFSYHSEENKYEIDTHFTAFYNGINASIREGGELVTLCFRNKDFVYDSIIQQKIAARRTNLGNYDQIQFQHLNRICGILNE